MGRERSGRMSSAENVEHMLALAIAELSNAYRAEDLEHAQEHIALARDLVGDALTKHRKTK